jgi:hypothetical protein
MKVLTCAATRRRLHQYHDDELAVGDQIAVSAHLAWCDACGDALGELRVLRSTLRMAAGGRLQLSNEEEERFERAVVSRAGAERRPSLLVRLREAFDDRHLVYACGGASVAAVVCVLVTLAMMRVAVSTEPDSLAAMFNVLAKPGTDVQLVPDDPYQALALLGSNQNPVALDSSVQMPRPLDEGFSTDLQDGDGVIMLAAVVTREGRVANLELVQSTNMPAPRPGVRSSRRVEDFLGAVSRARFEPASLAGLPVAANMLWLVTHTTVRAPGLGIDLPVPPPKKRRVIVDQTPGSRFSLA